MLPKRNYFIVFIILSLGLFLGIKLFNTYTKNKEKDIEIYYSYHHNDGYFWLLKQNDTIYDISSAYNYSDMYGGDIHQYAKAKGIERKYASFNLDVKTEKKFEIFSMSQNLCDTHYSIHHKMAFDIQINNIGNVKVNISFPNDKQGGYSFKLSKKDLHILVSLMSRAEYETTIMKNNFCGIAISIDDTITNDYNLMKNNKNIQALIMFSNFIVMKYLKNRPPKENSRYDIITSKYTKLYSPPPR